MRLYDCFAIAPDIPVWSGSFDLFKSVDITDVIEELSSHVTPLPREDALKKFEVLGTNPRETYTVPLDNPLLENQRVVGYVLRDHHRMVEVSIAPFLSEKRYDGRESVGVICTLNLQSWHSTEGNLYSLKLSLESSLKRLYPSCDPGKKQK